MTAYKCSAGIWTIGIGHTKNVKQGDVINNTQAQFFFDEDSIWVTKTILYTKLSINQNQFDALFSLIFNIGSNKFISSTLLRLLKDGAKRKGIETAWSMWNKIRDNGELKISKSLSDRRKREIELFYKL